MLTVQTGEPLDRAAAGLGSGGDGAGRGGGDRALRRADRLVPPPISTPCDAHSSDRPLGF